MVDDEAHLLRVIRNTRGPHAGPGPALHRVTAGDAGLGAVLGKLLQIEPDLRCSVRAAAALPYWRAPGAEVRLAAARTERGPHPGVLAAGPLVSQWLQADPPTGRASLTTSGGHTRAPRRARPVAVLAVMVIL